MMVVVKMPKNLAVIGNHNVFKWKCAGKYSEGGLSVRYKRQKLPQLSRYCAINVPKSPIKSKSFHSAQALSPFNTEIPSRALRS
jgi:hypothetical protein